VDSSIFSPVSGRIFLPAAAMAVSWLDLLEASIAKTVL